MTGSEVNGKESAVKRRTDISDAGYPKRGNNYVLIGLPSCGKSTIGRRAAEELGLDFYDTAKIIVEALGDSLSFFGFSREYGDKETQVLLELLDKAERSVIATGGSVLSLDRNIPILKRLGYIFFIDRDPEILLAVCKSRYSVKIDDEDPIDLDTLTVKSHMDLNYADTADITVENHGTEDLGLANLISKIKDLERNAWRWNWNRS
jgi:shikimate kinase